MINQDRLIKIFLELVKIDSPSGEEKEIAEEVAKRLEQKRPRSNLTIP